LEEKMMFFIIALLFIILGITIRFGKASWLIAGYNTSSEQEKEEYDEKALCTFVGRLMFVLAAIWLAMALAKLLFPLIFTTILIIGIFLFVGVVIAAVVYMNAGNRFKSHND
jgi:uncharacterized membrane protein